MEIFEINLKKVCKKKPVLNDEIKLNITAEHIIAAKRKLKVGWTFEVGPMKTRICL